MKGLPSDTGNISRISATGKTEGKGQRKLLEISTKINGSSDSSTTKSQVFEWCVLFFSKGLAQIFRELCIPREKQAKGRQKSTLALPHSPSNSVLKSASDALEPESEYWPGVRLSRDQDDTPATWPFYSPWTHNLFASMRWHKAERVETQRKGRKKASLRWWCLHWPLRAVAVSWVNPEGGSTPSPETQRPAHAWVWVRAPGDECREIKSSLSTRAVLCPEAN